MAVLRASRLCALLVAVVLAPLAPGQAVAQLYEWTDDEGVVRYTNDLARIPEEFRARARDIGSPRPRPPEPAASGVPRPSDRATVIPFRAGDPIIAAARLNGVALTLIVDTGADRTMISPSALARAGVGGDGERQVNVVGVAGSVIAREVVVPLLDVAGTRVGPLRVIAHDPGAGGPLGTVDGLLGRDVLDYFTLTIDAAAGRATLTPR